MKQINNYILEKLHLNKEITVEMPEIIINIAKLCDVNIKKSDTLIKFDKETVEEISKWIDNSNVTDFKAFADHDALRKGGLPEDMIDEFKNVSKNFVYDCEIKHLRGKMVEYKWIENTHNWYRTIESFEDYLIVYDGQQGTKKEDGIYRMFKKS